MLIVMMYSVVTLQAANGDNSNTGICGLNSKNIYADDDLSTSKAMDKYHELVNNKFNYYTQLMLKGQEQAAKTKTPDPNSIAPPGGKACTRENYSTYCVSKEMLRNQDHTGYMDYYEALICRRNRVFDTKTEALSYADVGETILSAGISTPGAVESQYPAVYQLQKTLEISARLDAINREIDSAKQALDVTLATYDELKTAWAMHKRYIVIYENLVKYRDKLVEIRHQVEDFPSKFIDATTTMCN